MRTWVKATIGTGVLATVCIVALAGIASYFALVEIIDPRRETFALTG